jgi:hypothetical protein
MGEAGLAQARRPVEQDMVDGLATAPGGGDGNLEIFFGLVLPDKVGQGTRPEAGIQGRVFYIGLSGNDTSDFSPPRQRLISIERRGVFQYFNFTTSEGFFSPPEELFYLLFVFLNYFIYSRFKS